LPRDTRAPRAGPPSEAATGQVEASESRLKLRLSRSQFSAFPEVPATCDSWVWASATVLISAAHLLDRLPADADGARDHRPRSAVHVCERLSHDTYHRGRATPAPAAADGAGPPL